MTITALGIARKWNVEHAPKTCAMSDEELASQIESLVSDKIREAISNEFVSTEDGQVSQIKVLHAKTCEECDKLVLDKED